MASEIEKKAIRSAFGRAAGQYDSVAEVQRRIANGLIKRTPPFLAATLLDAGSGTGFGARLLEQHCPNADIFSLDAAHAMCQQAGRTLTLCGDIEALPLANASLDLYWSSLAWQWTQPELSIAEAARVLKPGGILRIATLGPATLHELRTSFSELDDHRHVREFHDAASHLNALVTHGFIDIQIEQRNEFTFAPDLITLLRDIRRLGAHALDGTRRRGMLGSQAWNRLQAAYESFREERGLPVRYDVITLCATRPKE
jgi:malonyl-CoA O-methyltransferase